MCHRDELETGTRWGRSGEELFEKARGALLKLERLSGRESSPLASARRTWSRCLSLSALCLVLLWMPDVDKEECLIGST